MREWQVRLLVPVLLSGVSVALGVALTSAIEQSRSASHDISIAMAAVADASRLVAPLRLSNAEMVSQHAVSYQELWLEQKQRLDGLARDPASSAQRVSLREPIERTSALFAAAAAAASGPPAGLDAASRNVAREAAAVWVLWHRAEAELNSRLAIELAGPQEKWSAAALLSILGCLLSGLLFWAWWRESERGREVAAVESRLREQESRARALAEASRELLLQCEPDSGRILRSNRKINSLFVADLLGSAEPWREAMGTISGTGELPVGEVRVHWEDRQVRAEWRAWAVRDPGGNLIRVDMAFLDVTAWDLTRQAGLQRIAELEQARDKLERQGRELLEQSFELAESRATAQQVAAKRLDSVVRWGRSLAKPLEEAAALAAQLEGDAPPPQREATKTLARTIDTVANSLLSLAEYVGIENSPGRGESLAFSPRALLEEVAEEWVERAEAKGVEMPCFFDPALPDSVRGDLPRIRRALSQVTEHAVRQTGTGEVALRIAVETRAERSAELRIEVEDSGVGSTPEELLALFEPFAAGSSGNEAASRLAIAKRLVESIGGQIGGESDRGQGTRIWIVIPVELVAAAATRAHPWPDCAGRRVLIVDDVASVRGAMAELASSLGLTAVTCDDGARALTQIRGAAGAGTPYDFLLADCEMPGVSGIQLAESILDEPELASTGVILTIPFSQRRWIHELPMQGIRGLLTKPIRRQMLIDLLRGQRPETPLPAQAGALVPDSGDETDGETSAKPGYGLTPNVLIVEDNLVNQRVAIRLVEKMGLRAEVVPNGLEAIRAVQRETYDLILMDCQMPEVDGYTATAEIRRMEGRGGRVPIIAMTANAMRGDREKCLEAGMDDYIPKPVAFEDLRVLVTRWLARAEAAKM